MSSSSSKQLPFEVLEGITCYLEKNDKLSSLTVCKSWYRPFLESLYHHVVISTFFAFRSFLLSITHHRDFPSIYVKKLEIDIDPWDAYGRGERPITFTEFELLARYCINLNELSFLGCDHNEYWRLLNNLDLDKLWPRLHKLHASVGLQDSFSVYRKMGGRLKEISICGLSRPLHELMNLLPLLYNLETISIADSTVTIDTNSIRQINDTHPRLRNLILKTKVAHSDNIDTTTTTTTTVRSLTCDIDHPNSAWFTLLKTWYKDIDILTIRCINREGDIDQLLQTTQSILEPIHYTNIPHLHTKFININDFVIFVENFIVDTIYEYTIKDNSSTPSSISLNFYYHDSLGPSTNAMESKSSGKRRKKKRHTQHEFNITCALDTEYDYNEMLFLGNIIQKPIHLQLEHLTLTRSVDIYPDRPPYRREFIIKTTRPLYLDSVLNYFPNLESLTFTLNKNKVHYHLRRKGNKKLLDAEYEDDFDYTEVTILDKSQARRWPSSLRILKIRSSKIDRSVYHYLFKKCPKLSRLCIQDCNFRDDETLIALEYLCLEHHVDLIIL